MTFFRIDLDKRNPKGTVKIKPDPEDISGKNLVLIDDVLNTGRTIAYSMIVLLDKQLNKIEVATLVDRGHRQFPIMATFYGYSLPTTLEEHIEVTMGKSPAVYLY